MNNMFDEIKKIVDEGFKKDLVQKEALYIMELYGFDNGVYTKRVPNPFNIEKYLIKKGYSKPIIGEIIGKIFLTVLAHKVFDADGVPEESTGDSLLDIGDEDEKDKEEKESKYFIIDKIKKISKWLDKYSEEIKIDINRDKHILSIGFPSTEELSNLIKDKKLFSQGIQLIIQSMLDLD